MSKVLITGGGGFIGANAVRAFLTQEYEVHVLEYPGCDLWRLEEVKEHIGIHTVDITKYEELEAFIQSLKPEIILHFAAYGAYQGTQQDIQKTIDTNLLGTINLVNACAKVGFEAFIHTGSSSEYGIKDQPMKETDILEASNLYGMAKAAATLYCQAQAKREGLPIAVMRPFAVYGPFEDQKRLIPTLVASYLKGESPKLSSPRSVRDYIFVEDVVGAYRSAITRIEQVKGEVFNVGGGKEYTIEEVVSMVRKITASDLDAEYGQISPNQEEPEHWVADISKAKKLLGWGPTCTMEQGLEKTVNWFREFYGL